MIFEINFTYIMISICLWIYAIENTLSTIVQIDNTTVKKEVTKKTRASYFIHHVMRIWFFVVIYFTGVLTSINMISLKYFIIFVVIHHMVRIIYGFRKYPNNIKTYSMWEIYVNMILYASTVFWMCYLWIL